MQKAFKEVYLGASWQRCKVHFMRNILAHIPHKREICSKTQNCLATRKQKRFIGIAQMIIQEFGKKFPEAIETLQNSLEDSLQFYHFPKIDFVLALSLRKGELVRPMYLRG
nr:MULTISPECIES: transposase [unclassified Nitratiruptor]